MDNVNVVDNNVGGVENVGNIKIDEVKMKTCTKCGNTYPATSEYFHKKSDNKDDLNSRCKKCKCANGSKFKGLLPFYEFGQYISNEETIEIYKLLLEGKIDKFIPNPIYTKENIIACYRYLIDEVLKWDIDYVLKNFKPKIFKKYKLAGMTNKYFNSFREAIILAYPEHKLHILDFKCNLYRNYWDKEYNQKEAIDWLISKLKKDGIINSIEDIPKNINNEIVDSYGLRSLVKRFNDSFIKMFQWYFYNFTDYKPKLWEYKKMSNGYWNEETIVEAVKDICFLEGFDGKSVDWLLINFNMNLLYKYNISTVSTIYCLGKLLEISFPELNIIKKSYDGYYFHSKEELQVYNILKNNFNSNLLPIGKTNEYKFHNKLENENYCPDFIISTIDNKMLDKPIIIEYFGLWTYNLQKQYYNYNIYYNYNMKTIRKSKYFNSINDIYFFSIYPKDLWKKGRLIEKFNNFLIKNNLKF